MLTCVPTCVCACTIWQCVHTFLAVLCEKKHLVSTKLLALSTYRAPPSVWAKHSFHACVRRRVLYMCTCACVCMLACMWVGGHVGVRVCGPARGCACVWAGKRACGRAGVRMCVRGCVPASVRCSRARHTCNRDYRCFVVDECRADNRHIAAVGRIQHSSIKALHKEDGCSHSLAL